MRYRIFAAVFGIALGLGAAAEAQQTYRASALQGWEAVGRLTISNKSMCTGALIAPDTVLTAAHCLYDPANGRAINPRRIVFDAGLDQGKARASRSVASAVIHPGYSHSRRGPAQAGVDIAVLKLDSPISTSVIRPLIPHERPETGEAVGLVSYTHLQRNTAILQHPCEVLARKNDTLVTNCPVEFGASGAPVFAVQGGAQPRLVSVISAKAAMGNRPVSVGTILDAANGVIANNPG